MKRSVVAGCRTRWLTSHGFSKVGKLSQVIAMSCKAKLRSNGIIEGATSDHNRRISRDLFQKTLKALDELVSVFDVRNTDPEQLRSMHIHRGKHRLKRKVGSKIDRSPSRLPHHKLDQLIWKRVTIEGWGTTHGQWSIGKRLADQPPQFVNQTNTNFATATFLKYF